MYKKVKHKNLKIFLANDSEIVLKKVSELLNTIEGVKIVGQAKNSHDTLQNVKKTRPDVIILDIKMPGKSGSVKGPDPAAAGIETLNIIKDEKLVPVVIMLTNYPYPEYFERCRELGADYFFDKSKEFNQLIETIQVLVKKVLTDDTGNFP
ncbi:response regulator [bacterium]|nr:response regulator [bacterium]MBU1874029.1 response regulator [bacterium]